MPVKLVNTQIPYLLSKGEELFQTTLTEKASWLIKFQEKWERRQSSKKDQNHYFVSFLVQLFLTAITYYQNFHSKLGGSQLYKWPGNNPNAYLGGSSP